MNENKSIKIEIIEGSKKLYFIFGGVASGIGMPPFEFAKASNILQESKVFVRDLSQCWYLTGIPGISTSLDGTVKYFKEIIETHRPSEVVMVGNSMGGWAAILFASFIDNASAVAFSPQTFISPSARLANRDFRWQKKVLNTYRQNFGKKVYYNLITLDLGNVKSIDIHVATTDRLDLLHARHLSENSKVNLTEYDFGGHNLVKDLRDQGRLSEILIGK